MNQVFLPMIVASRWTDALTKQDLPTWRACAYLAGLEADLIEHEEPNHVLVPMLRGIASDAHSRYMALMPKAAA